MLTAKVSFLAWRVGGHLFSKSYLYKGFLMPAIKNANFTLTGTPAVIVPSNREDGYNYIELTNTGAADALVGTGLDSAGDLVNFFTMAAGTTRIFKTEAVKTARFYATGSDSFATSYGGDGIGTQKLPNFQVVRQEAKLAPASQAEFTLAVSRIEGFSYILLKVTGANSVNFAWELPGGVLGTSFTVAAAAEKIIETKSIGQAGLYMQANTADSFIEAAFG